MYHSPPYNPDHFPFGFSGGPLKPTHKLYSTKQTPRGSVVVFGDEVVFEYEMTPKEAQEAADWLNHRKSA